MTLLDATEPVSVIIDIDASKILRKCRNRNTTPRAKLEVSGSIRGDNSGQ
jgi:hypothetical protein